MRWYHERTRFSPQSRPIAFVQAVYSIDHVKVGHAGNFFCYGQHPNEQRHFLAKAQLIVYGEFLLDIIVWVFFLRYKIYWTFFRLYP